MKPTAMTDATKQTATTHAAKRTTIRKSALLAGAVVLAALAVIPVFLSSYYVGLVILIMIYAVFAMSLDVLLGYTGLPALGHVAGFGVAAYVTGYLALRVLHSFWLEAAAGLLATLLVAALFGTLALRTRGVYFMMITLALSQVLWGIAYKWTSVTRGEDGLTGIPRPNLGIPGLSLDGPIPYYYFTLIIFLLSATAMYLIVQSPFGLVLRGIRDSETRMSALGYNIWRYQYASFLITSFFAGIAGILSIYYQGLVVPNYLNIVTSAKGILMVAAGGPGTLVGPIIGAVGITLLENIISAYTERWVLILGAIYILVILFAPRGIYRPLRRRMSAWLSAKAQ